MKGEVNNRFLFNFLETEVDILMEILIYAILIGLTACGVKLVSTLFEEKEESRTLRNFFLSSFKDEN